jgi:two-component system NtrC family sensor kinase
MASMEGKENRKLRHSGRKIQEFHAVSYRILRFANRGLLRTDFQREVSKLLVNFFKCDALELWLKEHEKCYISEVRTRASGFQIKFRTSPSWDGQETEMIQAGQSRRYQRTGDYRSLATIPIMVGREKVGALRLKSRRKAVFTGDKARLFDDLAQILGIALIHRRIQVDLRERVKELTCLYEIALLGAQPGISLDKILQGIVELLPPAWLYPQITSARILLGNRSYTTRGFRVGLHQQKAEIVIGGEKHGTVEVTYDEEKPELDEGPFLVEERKLIEAVAKEIGIVLERRKDEEEKLRLQEQLRHADRLVTIGQLAAGVAHELNEPLGSILGFAQLAKKSSGLPAQVGQDIEKILNASLYAREVVRKLLMFARQMPPRKMHVNLNQIIEEGLYFFESRCAKEGIELVRSVAPDLPEIYADPSQLNQVLVNLVVNALQAMPEGGKLRVQTLNCGDYISLIVEDNGLGMSDEVLKKIFTPFFTTKDVGQGTGLGLPVVHGIITSHGGSINVESKVKLGTRFDIRLPVKGVQDLKENHADGASSE